MSKMILIEEAKVKQALEALEEIMGWQTLAPAQAQRNEHISITSLRQAIAETEKQEPVDSDGSPCPEFWDWLPKAYRDGDIGDAPRFTKYNMEVAFLAGKQSTHPPKREWVGLTDEGIVWLMPEPTIQSANVQRWDRKAMHEFARAIEAKLKEKNT